MKATFKFAVKLLVISILLFLAKGWVALAYGALLDLTAGIALRLFRPGFVLVLTGGSFFNVEIGVIPLAALVIAAPGVAAGRKAALISAGTLAFLSIDLLAILLGLPLERDISLFDTGSAAYTIYRTVLLSLPLVLWIAGCYRWIEEPPVTGAKVTKRSKVRS
ncbi:MAG: hypothetical protein ACYC1U_07295 [Candidatus Aquicultorales bacterium]